MTERWLTRAGWLVLLFALIWFGGHAAVRLI